MQTSNTDLYFGGPDLAKNHLRDILLNCIEQSPSGSEIKWLCYYLNDNAILDALIKAAKRAVNVTILIDKHPRIVDVNTPTIEKLSQYSSATLKLVTLEKKPVWHYIGIKWHAHFHSKCYYFSHPTPHVYLGSYNPTAALPELPTNLVKEVGDHSISHNLLAKILDPKITSFLYQHISNMQNSNFVRGARIYSLQNRSHSFGEWKIDFLPRYTSHPISHLLQPSNKKAYIRCAISHLKGPQIKKIIARARQKHEIEILLETSKRRVSTDILDYLLQRNIKIHHPKLPENCLMHSKFILYDNGHEQKVMFGSFNWSARSRLLNHEIIVTTTNKGVYRKLLDRWNDIIQ